MTAQHIIPREVRLVSRVEGEVTFELHCYSVVLFTFRLFCAACALLVVLWFLRFLLLIPPVEALNNPMLFRALAVGVFSCTGLVYLLFLSRIWHVLEPWCVWCAGEFDKKMDRSIDDKMMAFNQKNHRLNEMNVQTNVIQFSSHSRCHLALSETSTIVRTRRLLTTFAAHEFIRPLRRSANPNAARIVEHRRIHSHHDNEQRGVKYK